MDEHFQETYKKPKVFISHATADKTIVEKMSLCLNK